MIRTYFWKKNRKKVEALLYIIRLHQQRSASQLHPLQSAAAVCKQHHVHNRRWPKSCFDYSVAFGRVLWREACRLGAKLCAGEWKNGPLFYLDPEGFQPLSDKGRKTEHQQWKLSAAILINSVQPTIVNGVFYFYLQKMTNQARLIWYKDRPITGNVLKLSAIVEPRKPLDEYKEGDEMTARCPYYGNQPAVIGNKYMQPEFQYHGYLYYLYTKAMPMSTYPLTWLWRPYCDQTDSTTEWHNMGRAGGTIQNSQKTKTLSLGRVLTVDWRLCAAGYGIPKPVIGQAPAGQPVRHSCVCPKKHYVCVWYHSLMAHQHQKSHTVPKQVIMIATSIQVATV